MERCGWLTANHAIELSLEDVGRSKSKSNAYDMLY